MAEISLVKWRLSMDLTDDMSTLVQVMASCRQATSHYLSQCWPSFMTPYGATMSQSGDCECCDATSMKTPKHGNAFRITGPLWGDSTIPGGFPSQGWIIPSFSVHLLLAWTICSTKKLSVIWDAMTLMWRHCNGHIVKMYCVDVFNKA